MDQNDRNREDKPDYGTTHYRYRRDLDEDQVVVDVATCNGRRVPHAQHGRQNPAEVDFDLSSDGRRDQIAIARVNSVARLHEGVTNGQLKYLSKQEANILNDGDL